LFAEGDALEALRTYATWQFLKLHTGDLL
jgi:hypothetical protein